MKTMEKVRGTATLLQKAWGDAAHRVAGLPAELQPENLGQAYAVQETVSAATGRIGGWKVLPGRADAVPLCAPVPLSYLRRSGACIPRREWPDGQLRVTLCFRLVTSLASYDAPYTAEQAHAAIGTCHVGAEAVQSRLDPPPPRDDLAFVADSLSCGPLVTGTGTASWQHLDLARLPTRILVNGRELQRRDARSELDISATLRWLAEHGAAWAGGLMVGHVIEIGLHLDTIRIPHGASVRVEIDSVGDVVFRADAEEPGRAGPLKRHWWSGLF